MASGVIGTLYYGYRDTTAREQMKQLKSEKDSLSKIIDNVKQQKGRTDSILAPDVKTKMIND